MAGRLLKFEGFVLDPGKRRLTRRGREIRLPDKPFDLLVALACRPGEVLSKQDLLTAVWGGVHVEENTVERTVAELRTLLGDSARRPRFIKTVYGRGYVFLPSVESTEPPALAPQRSARARRGILLTGALSLGLVAGGAFLFWTNRAPEQVAEIQVRRLTYQNSRKLPPPVTDGRTIFFGEFYRGGYRIARTPAGGGAVTPFPTPVANPCLAAISPDLSRLLVRSVTRQWIEYGPLWLLPLDGGPPNRLGELRGYDGSWSPDGETLAITTEREIVLVNRDGARIRRLADLVGAWWPRWSPDGSLLRFSVLDQATFASSLWEVKPDGTGLRRLFSDWAGGAGLCCGSWSPDGRHFVFQSSRGGSDQIWIAPGRAAGAPGNPRQITWGPISFRAPAFSPDGKTIVAIGSDLRAEIMKFDEAHRQFVPYLPGVFAESVAFSPGGSRIAYVRLPDFSLCLWRREPGTPLQLTRPPLRVGLIEWSPAGDRIAFMGKTWSGYWTIYVISADGGVPGRVLVESRHQADPTWSPDGKALLFGRIPVLEESPESVALQLVDLESGGVSTLPGSRGLFSPRWSPDGRFIAALHASDNRLFVLDRRANRWTALTGVWAGYPCWSPDSRYVYFLSREAERRLLRRVRLADRHVEEVADLAAVEPPPTTLGDWIGITPEGAPLAARNLSTQEIYAIRWRE